MLTVEAAATDDFDLRPMPGQKSPFAWARVAGVLAAAAAAAGLLVGDPFAVDTRATSKIDTAAANAATPTRSTPIVWDEPPQSCDDPSFMPVVFNQECVVVEEAAPPPPAEPKSDCDDHSSVDCVP